MQHGRTLDKGVKTLIPQTIKIMVLGESGYTQIGMISNSFVEI